MAQPSGYQNPNAKGNKSAAKPKAAPKKIKVPQSTIDYIKKLGMTQALKQIEAYGRQSRMMPNNPKYATMRWGGKDLLETGEFSEGVRRMYGKARFDKAAAPKPKKASTAYSPAPYKKPKPKSGGAGSSKVK